VDALRPKEETEGNAKASGGGDELREKKDRIASRERRIGPLQANGPILAGEAPGLNQDPALHCAIEAGAPFLLTGRASPRRDGQDDQG